MSSVAKGMGRPAAPGGYLPDRNGELSVYWWYTAFITMLLGIKIGLIAEYGSLVPFWDQWDAEALYLYAPFLQGELDWQSLLGAHNEHRILTTRLLALGLLVLSGEWNPLLQMTVNAVIHVAALVLLLSLSQRLIGLRLLPAVLIFSIALFGIPYAYENTLAGFQSQFYFVTFFSIAGLYLLVTSTVWVRRWWFGLVCALLAFLSFASGLLMLAAVVTTAGVQYGVGVAAQKKRHVAGMIALMLLFVAGYMLTPQIAGHAALKASGFESFWRALLDILSWPYLEEGRKGGIALLMLLPGVLFMASVVWQRPACEDVRWFVFALVVWGVAQVASVAYGRAVGSLAPRYLDLFAVLILINFVCLLALFRMCPVSRKGWGMLAVGLWAALVGNGLIRLVSEDLPSQLAYRRDVAHAHMQSMSAYLNGGEMVALPGYTLPYPDAGRLQQILEISVVRQILPSSLQRQTGGEAAAVSVSGLWILDAILTNYVKIVGLGILAVLMAILQAARVKAEMLERDAPGLRGLE